MTISEIQAKSLLRKHKKIDSWFISKRGMNIYRGCTHDCSYCDGRAEKYQVQGEFGKDVAVKINAIELLKKELGASRRLFPPKEGYIIVGGGVGDSYQSIENKYGLTRKALEFLSKVDYPVHMLTKSILIERDMDILKEINDRTGVLASMSFSSVDDEISGIFEPGVPPPSERLAILAKFKNEGIPCGMFLMPVIPYITDDGQNLERTVKAAADIGLDYIIFGGMTLKGGRQQEHLIEVLDRHYPQLKEEYCSLYTGKKYGQATAEYYMELHNRLFPLAKKYKMPVRIPLKLFKDHLNPKDLVIVILEQVDYLLKTLGKSSPYGFAAYSISQTRGSMASIKGDLKNIKGVGKIVEGQILEILERGTSSYYERLMGFE